MSLPTVNESKTTYLEDTRFSTSNVLPSPTILLTSNLVNSASLPYATVPFWLISRHPSTLSIPPAAPTDIVGTPTPGKFPRLIQIPLWSILNPHSFSHLSPQPIPNTTPAFKNHLITTPRISTKESADLQKKPPVSQPAPSLPSTLLLRP